jgi:hypothetical protein
MRTLAAIVVFTALAVPVHAARADEPTPGSVPDAAGLVAKLDELWKTRDEAASISATNELIKEGNRSLPNDYGFLWRAARFRWWTADGLGADDKSKRMFAKEGWNYASRAVAANPTGAEAKYYVAVNIGGYSQAVGILKALSEGLEGQFNDNLEFAMKNNEAFDRHGAHTAKGRYWWELPWPKRDLAKSKDELNKGLSTNPEHLRTHLFLAETLLKDGDAKAAKVEVDKVLNGDASYDPPEARRIKQWAKGVAEQIADALK